MRSYTLFTTCLEEELYIDFELIDAHFRIRIPFLVQAMSWTDVLCPYYLGLVNVNTYRVVEYYRSVDKGMGTPSGI